MNLKGKTAFITGASRGIGKAIALKLASHGVNIVVAAKTVDPHPKLEGTIHTAVEEIRTTGADALAVQMDVRFEEQVQAAVQQGVDHFGGLDILINNASAIQLTPVEHTPMKRYDLMHQVNIRGTYMTSKIGLPFLKESDIGQILMLSPPLTFNPMWYGNHLAYTMSKMGMSMCVLGMAEEFAPYNICVNALWPKTTIATAAVQNLLGGDAMIKASRTPEIVADAAYAIFTDQERPTGKFLIDEEVLQAVGMTDFSKYRVDPTTDLMPDLFL